MNKIKKRNIFVSVFCFNILYHNFYAPVWKCFITIFWLINEGNLINHNLVVSQFFFSDMQIEFFPHFGEFTFNFRFIVVWFFFLLKTLLRIEYEQLYLPVYCIKFFENFPVLTNTCYLHEIGDTILTTENSLR